MEGKASHYLSISIMYVRGFIIYKYNSWHSKRKGAEKASGMRLWNREEITLLGHLELDLILPLTSVLALSKLLNFSRWHFSQLLK